MSLKTLPSIIRENKFNDQGLVETNSGLLVPAYVGSGLGFNHPGRVFLNGIFYPKLRKSRVLELCPFKACGEYLDFSKMSGDMSVMSQLEFWNEFGNIIGKVNYETLMPRAKFMIGLFEGHAADEGLAAEVAHFANNHGPVIGIRTDFRLAENPAAPINPAIRYFIDNGPFEGQFFSGEETYEQAYKAIENLADKFREE